MAFIPVPETVRAAIRNVVGTTNLVNTLWFYNPGGWSVGEAENLADQLVSWWSSEVLPILNVTVVATDVTVYDMQTPDSWFAYEAFAPNETGSNPDTPASLASAMTVTFQTNRRGRSFRGRNYISGFGETQVGNKLFVDTTRDAVDAAYGTLPTYILGTGGIHVVASLWENKAPREVGLTTPVNNYRANHRIYKQGDRTK